MPISKPRSWLKVADGNAGDPEIPGRRVVKSGWFWIHRQLAEAAILLTIARLLVRFVRFGRWRGALGHLAPGPHSSKASGNGCLPDDLDRYLSRVVDRAALRLPFECLCLSRAMALHWMLARRGRRSTLVFGVLPGPRRGHLDDLHAWVELGGEVLIGDSPEPYAVLTRLHL